MEAIKDSYKYVPEFLKILLRKIYMYSYIKTPENKLPLFNGGTCLNLNQIQKYLDNCKPINR